MKELGNLLQTLETKQMIKITSQGKAPELIWTVLEWIV